MLKYRDDLKETFNAYGDAYDIFSDAIVAYDYETAKKALEDTDNALTAIENITAPPQYADIQKKYADSIQHEHEYLELCRKFIAYSERVKSLTEDELKDFQAVTDSMGENANTSEFIDLYMKAVKAVTADIKGNSD